MDPAFSVAIDEARRWLRSSLRQRDPRANDRLFLVVGYLQGRLSGGQTETPSDFVTTGGPEELLAELDNLSIQTRILPLGLVGLLALLRACGKPML